MRTRIQENTMRTYLTRKQSARFLTWLDKLGRNPTIVEALIFYPKTTFGGPSGDYEQTESFYKPDGSLAFSYTINSARTETRIFIEI